MEMEGIETSEPTSWFGQAIDVGQRIHRILVDPTVREGWEALLRTLANLGITIADFAPGGLGEVGSLTADTMKGVARVTGLKKLDLTKDVSVAIAVGSELAEIPTAGAAPSHAVESLMQFRYDLPRMREGGKAAIELWRRETADFIDHKEELTGAMTAFGVTPPEVEGGANG